MKKVLLIGMMSLVMVMHAIANPVDDLLERIDKGASKKFKIEMVKSQKDFFELLLMNYMSKDIQMKK